MPHFDDTVLQAIPYPALIAADRHVARFNDAAKALFPDLAEGGPVPVALSLPDGGSGVSVAGGNCWVSSASPLPGGTLLLLRPAPPEGLSDAQLTGVVRRLREQAGHLMVYLQLLKNPAKTERILPGLNREVCCVLRLTNELDLLHDLSAGSYPFRPAALDLAGLCREVTAACASLLESIPVGLDFDSPLTSLLAEGDDRLLSDLLLELIGNAAKAAGPGGRLTLSLARSDGRAILRLTGGGARDDGRPLAELLAGEIPADRIPRPEEGAGLGLALVRHILALHGGSMVMERKDGVSVTLALPLAPPAPPTMLRTPRAEHSSGFSRELVALADLLPEHLFASPEL